VLTVSKKQFFIRVWECLMWIGDEFRLFYVCRLCVVAVHHWFRAVVFWRWGSEMVVWNCEAVMYSHLQLHLVVRGRLPSW